MKRVLSGFRATGNVHIGNIFGALLNWVKLQDDYECLYEVADLHTLTTSVNSNMEENIKEMVRDWLSCGITPEKSTIFVQSMIPAHAELHLLLSMIVPLPWLQRNPTIKEQIRDLGLEDKINYGLLGYPVLQAVDILIYKADFVPVGEDQVPHIEITRDIASRFNYIFDCHVFTIPEPILPKYPKILGIDGKKMSKSLNNAIFLKDSESETIKKVKEAFTDPLKIHKNDKGHPDGCVVFSYHRIIHEDRIDGIRADCESGLIGCVECKMDAAKGINEFLIPFRESRSKIKDEYIVEILKEGTNKARKIAEKTLAETKSAMKLWKGG